MPSPNTRTQNLQERARKAINRKFERMAITEADIDEAAEAFALTDYNSFFGDCRRADHPTARCGALWNALKERGEAPEGGSATPSDDDGTSGTSDAATTTEPPAPDPGAPEPESLDDLEAELRQADAVYLITQPGCPACQQAKESLEDWIEAGLVSVEDVQESDLGADLVIEQEIDALPAMVLEDDGERLTI